METKCSACGAMMQEGETRCEKCKEAMSCTAESCSCKCGNTVGAAEVKCGACLGGATK